MIRHPFRRGALAAGIVLILAGCTGGPSRAAVDQNQRNWDAIGARYQRYVEGDRALNADDKRIRLQELSEAKKLAAELAAQAAK